MTVAELVQQTRQLLHRAALLQHCGTGLTTSFSEEGSPSAYLLQIDGYGPQPVDDEALILLQVELAEMSARAQRDANALLRRVVAAEEAPPPEDVPQLSARVVRNAQTEERKK